MGAIDAFSIIDGCNCTHCTPLAAALFYKQSISDLLRGWMFLDWRLLKTSEFKLDNQRVDHLVVSAACSDN